MANKKITALEALDATPASLDVLPLVDVSDVSTTASGETKKITVENLLTVALRTAGGTMSGHLLFPDGVKAKFGDGSDLEIYHDAANSIIADTGTGALHLKATDLEMSNAAGSEAYMKAYDEGAVELYWGGVKELETTDGGVTITNALTLGTVVSGAWNGDPIDGAYLDIEGTEVKATGVDDDFVLTANGAGAAVWEVNTPTFTGILQDLDTLGAPTTNGEFIVATGEGVFAYESEGTARISLGLEIGVDVQGYDEDNAVTDVVQTFTAGQRGEVTALTDASTVAIDLADSNNFSLTLEGNRLLGTPSNPVAGQCGTIMVTQDSTGSRTLSYGAGWVFESGTAPTLTTTATTGKDILAYYVESASGPVVAVTILSDLRGTS